MLLRADPGHRVMERRTFLGVIAGSLLAAPLAAEAQQTGKVYRIGVLTPVPLSALEASSSRPKDQGGSSVPGPCADNPHNLLKWAFCQFGYVEGRNIAIEERWGGPDRLPALATELVSLKVDIIHAIGPVAIRAAKQATTTIPIPIVMMTSGDPVALGFVESVARPGGNITGVSFLGEKLSGKLLELFKQAVPRASRVAVLWNPANRTHANYLIDAQEAAQSLGVALRPLEVRASDDFSHIFDQVNRERDNAVLMLLDPLFTANARLIAQFSARSRVPALYGAREVADAGGLMTYGPNLAEMNRQMASYVDRILKGAKPADLPVEQPSKFELVINLKTAKALGLTIPPSLLQRADQVIE